MQCAPHGVLGQSMERAGRAETCTDRPRAEKCFLRNGQCSFSSTASRSFDTSRADSISMSKMCPKLDIMSVKEFKTDGGSQRPGLGNVIISSIQVTWHLHTRVNAPVAVLSRLPSPFNFIQLAIDNRTGWDSAVASELHMYVIMFPISSTGSSKTLCDQRWTTSPKVLAVTIL